MSGGRSRLQDGREGRAARGPIESGSSRAGGGQRGYVVREPRRRHRGHVATAVRDGSEHGGVFDTVEGPRLARGRVRCLMACPNLRAQACPTRLVSRGVRRPQSALESCRRTKFGRSPLLPGRIRPRERRRGRCAGDATRWSWALAAPRSGCPDRGARRRGLRADSCACGARGGRCFSGGYRSVLRGRGGASLTRLPQREAALRAVRAPGCAREGPVRKPGVSCIDAQIVRVEGCLGSFLHGVPRFTCGRADADVPTSRRHRRQ